MGEQSPLTGLILPSANILQGNGRARLGEFIEAAIALLDAIDVESDPDIPDFSPRSDGLPGTPDDAEPDDDDKGDVSWPEWHTRGRHKLVELLSGSHEPMARHEGVGMAYEDDEDDDPLEANGDEHDTGDAEDDELSHGAAHWGAYWNGGVAGCPISDPGGGDVNDQSESEQMVQDVLTLPVVSLDHNIFTDRRVALGMSNLQSSFVGEAVSADSGRPHRRLRQGDQPGAPV
jgi:hypothetical protein